MHIYNLIDNEKLHGRLSYFAMFECDSEIIDEVLIKTLKILDDLHSIDHLFSYLESKRFLCHLVFFQHFIKYEWIKYFETILKWFHERGFLKFKSSVQPYNHKYKKKKIYKIVKFRCYDLEFTMEYHFRYEFIKDFGRYFSKQCEDTKELKFSDI